MTSREGKLRKQSRKVGKEKDLASDEELKILYDFCAKFLFVQKSEISHRSKLWDILAKADK